MVNLFKRLHKLKSSKYPLSQPQTNPAHHHPQTHSNQPTNQPFNTKNPPKTKLTNTPDPRRPHRNRRSNLPNPPNSHKRIPPITRLHLTYAQKIYGGHQGARHFWRRVLPRLKYHNPHVPITVSPTTEQEGPAALTVYFHERLSSTAPGISGPKPVTDKYAPAPVGEEKSAVIDLKNLNYEEIWRRVQASTGAESYVLSPVDEEDLKKVADVKARAPGDRARNRAMRQAKRDQERMLAEARGEVEKSKQT